MLRIGPCRLQFTVTQLVAGFLQSIKSFPSVGCDSSSGKSVVLFMDKDLNFLFASSELDVLLLSVVSANIDVLPLSVVSSYCRVLPLSEISENSGEVVSLKSISSVVFVFSESVAKLEDFLSLTEPVSDLTHDICFPSPGT
jgi:hypothetical protein